MTISVDKLKGPLYCEVQDTTYDTELEEILDGVIANVISELDNSDFTESSDFDGYADLERAIYKQATYEWKRRRDLGLQSVSAPDGSVQKYEPELFLPEVQKSLDRHKVFTI